MLREVQEDKIMLISSRHRPTPRLLSALRFLVSIGVFVSVLPLTESQGLPQMARQVRATKALAALLVTGQEQNIHDLRQNQPIKQQLARSDAHSYRVTLQSGEYIRVVVEQEEIDVEVRLFGPEGQKVVETDNGPAPELESLSVLAETPGEYRLEISLHDKQAAAGNYEIRIEERRQATSRDKDHFAAQIDCWRANQLRNEGKAESVRKAIERYQQALSRWRAAEDPVREASTLNDIGGSYSRLGDTANALSYYSEALPIFQKIGDTRRESIVLNNLGGIYAMKGAPQKALEYFTRALELKKSLGDRRSEANSLYSIGAAYSQMGELQLALEYYAKALPLTQITRERLGESLILGSIGSAYFKMGEWQKALEYTSEGLAINRELGSSRALAAAIHNVGTILFQLGETEKALDHYAEALVLRRSTGDRHGEAYTLDSMGTAYFSLGDNQKALDHHKQALLLNRTVGDKYAEAYILGNLALVEARLGSLNEAMDHFNEALSINRTVGDRRGEALVRRHIGAAYEKLNDTQKAVEHFTTAVEIYRAIRDHNSEAGIMLDLARINRKQRRLNEARALMEASLDIIESARRTVASQELRASYMTTKRGFYEFYIDLLMQMHKEQPSAGYDAIALQTSERARARGLLDILAEARADIRQGVDPTLLSRERDLQNQVSLKSGQLTRLLSGKRSEEQETALRKEVEVLLQSYQDVAGQIRAKSPRYAALTQPNPLSLEQIQKQVLDSDTLLLEYSLGEDRSFVWAVTSTSIKAYELPDRAAVEAAALRVYGFLVSKADARFPEALTHLSRMLLDPVKDELGKKRLVIVSDGALQYLPFGALPVPSFEVDDRNRQISNPPSFEPLILNHEIVSLPSASVVASLRGQVRDRKSAPKTLAVLADPVFQKSDQRVRSANIKHIEERNVAQGTEIKLPSTTDVERSIREAGLDSFDRLTLSRREAELITSLVSTQHPLKALDFSASRATATSPDIEQYRIVHFATHSLLNNKHPELSGIVLSLVDEEGKPQDGFLRLYEIYNLKLSADLVVLSACQTALGREVKGEGLVGLTRGFMYAGAPRVVASLWKVSDRATAELMRRFYEKMVKEGLRPAAALRLAQVSMLKEKQWKAPYYWAGFVIQGEWR